MGARCRAGTFATPAVNPVPSLRGTHSRSAPAHLALKRPTPATGSAMSPPPPPPPREGDRAAAPHCRRAADAVTAHDSVMSSAARSAPSLLWAVPAVSGSGSWWRRFWPGGTGVEPRGGVLGLRGWRTAWHGVCPLFAF